MNERTAGPRTIEAASTTSRSLVQVVPLLEAAIESLHSNANNQQILDRRVITIVLGSPIDPVFVAQHEITSQFHRRELVHVCITCIDTEQNDAIESRSPQWYIASLSGIESRWIVRAHTCHDVRVV